MNETKYLVDNNALIGLTVRRTQTDFFRERCRITPDVLFEAQEHPEERRLREVTVDFTAQTFEFMRQLMQGVTPGDIGLVDLYRNRRAADPGLVAWIQEMVAADDGLLLRDEWILVTNDFAVRALAAEMGVSVATPDELARLIDAAGQGDANTGS